MFPVTIIDREAKKRGLHYLVIGGHAINAYCEPRATLDVDLLVRKGDKAQWIAMLSTEGYQLFKDGDVFVQLSPPYGVEWRLDLMLVNDSTFERMKAAAQSATLLDVTALIPSVQHLLALKFHVLKHGHVERFEKDFGDVVSLTRNAKLDPRTDAYRDLATRFGNEELYERILQRFR